MEKYKPQSESRGPPSPNFPTLNPKLKVLFLFEFKIKKNINNIEGATIPKFSNPKP